MKNVTLAQFIHMLNDEYRNRFGDSMEIEFTTFLRDLREDRKEALDLIMALAEKLKVPVNRGRVRDELLLKGTNYIVQDLYEEFGRVLEMIGDRNYRYRWGTIGAGALGVSIYFMFQGLGPQAVLVAFVASAIFERLRGIPRFY